MASDNVSIATKRKASLVPQGITNDIEEIQSVKKIHLERAATFGKDLFTHEPLDLGTTSIRLIEVLPGRDEAGRINCRLRHADTEAEYTCLSYVWGPQDVMQDISINGSLFFVGDGLWQFLKVASSESARAHNLGMPTKADEAECRPDFSFETATQSLWIDALCIDQANTLERNHQVQRMGHIYGKAKQVLSWLGNDSSSLASLFSRIREAELGELACFEPAYQAGVQDFDTKAYWKRAWITQEVSLAQYVYIVCGQNAVDLADAYYHLSGVSVELNLTQSDMWLALMKMRVGFYGQQASHRASVLSNLALFRHKDCWDVRDKVYSLLGISHDAELVTVDYDVPVSELAADLLRNYDNYFCLCHANLVRSTFELENFKTSDFIMTLRGRFMKRYAVLGLRECFTCTNCEVYVEWDTRNLKFERWNFIDLDVSCLKCEHASGNEEWGVHYGHVINLCGWDNGWIVEKKCFHVPYDEAIREVEGVIPQSKEVKEVTKEGSDNHWLAAALEEVYPTLEKASSSAMDEWRSDQEALPNVDITLSGLISLSSMPLVPVARPAFIRSVRSVLVLEPERWYLHPHPRPFNPQPRFLHPDPITVAMSTSYRVHGCMRKDVHNRDGHSWNWKTKSTVSRKR